MRSRRQLLLRWQSAPGERREGTLVPFLLSRGRGEAYVSRLIGLAKSLLDCFSSCGRRPPPLPSAQHALLRMICRKSHSRWPHDDASAAPVAQMDGSLEKAVRNYTYWLLLQVKKIRVSLICFSSDVKRLNVAFTRAQFGT